VCALYPDFDVTVLKLPTHCTNIMNIFTLMSFITFTRTELFVLNGCHASKEWCDSPDSFMHYKILFWSICSGIRNGRMRKQDMEKRSEWCKKWRPDNEYVILPASI
jgi:hypothetical protein